MTNGIFTSMHLRPLLHLWKIRQPYASSEVRSFSRNPFSCTAFEVPQAMAQMMTKPKCTGKMWDRYSSMILKSCCILSDLVTSDQSSNHGLTRILQTKGLLAGKLLGMSAKGNLPQIESLFQILRNEEDCEVQLTMSCQKCSKQMFKSSFFASDRCQGKKAMNMPEVK